MRFFTIKTQIFSAVAIVAMLVGCSGGKRETQISDAVKSVASVRTSFDQLELMEAATGLPRSSGNVQTTLSERGAMLSPSGGESISATLMQGSLELAAAFCKDAVAQKKANQPQKVFPAYVDLSKAPTLTAHPESTVIRPLAVHLLQQFSGEVADPQEVSILVEAIKSFFTAIASEGPNGGAGTEHAMTAACVTAAVNFQALLSR